MDTPQDPLPGGADDTAGWSSPADHPVVPGPAPASDVPELAPAAAVEAAPPPPPIAAAPLVPPPIAPPHAWEAPAEEAGPAPGFAFGGPGERLVAYIVDSLLITGIAILGFFVGLALAFVAPILTFIIWFLVTPIVCLGYLPWFWSRGGQTPGLKLFGMRVVRDRDGGPVSVGAAILRLIGFWIDALVLYIGFIWIFIDKRKRCWHDLIAGTVVVKRM